MSKAQWKIIYRVCFILAGFLLLRAFIKDYEGEQIIFDNISFYLAIVFIGVGAIIRKGTVPPKK